MIHYSIIPPEVVFQGFNDYQEQTHFFAEYKGEKIMVTKRPGNKFEITRLLSTRPASFLDPAYQPGNLVDMQDLKRISY